MIRDRWRVLFVLLLVVHLAPVWIFRFFPSQDGPSHLYNARLLTEMLEPANFQVRLFFEYSAALHPNLLAHVLLAALQLVVSPLVAEKLLLSLIVALFPLSLAYLLDSIRRGHVVFALLGFLYVYNGLLHKGFYGFNLGMALGFFTVGFWWRHRTSMTLADVGVLNVLLGITYVAHYATFGMALFVISSAAGWSFLLGIPRDTRKAVATLAVQVGYLLPAFIIATDYYLRCSGSPFVNYPKPGLLHEIFWEHAMLTSYTRWHHHLAPLVTGVLAFSALATAVHRIRRRQWILERDVFLLVAVVFAVLFSLLPKTANDAGRINERMYLFFVLYGSAWFAPFARPLRLGVGAVIIVLSLLHLGRLTYEYGKLQPELENFASGVELVEPHSTVAFEITGDGGDAEAFGKRVRYVKPLKHADSYYGLKRDVALFANYEINYPYFAIREGAAPREEPDYVILWPHLPEAPERTRYPGDYETIHRAGALALLKRRSAPLQELRWETTARGHRSLRLDASQKLWAGGAPGWLRLAPAKTWSTARGPAVGDSNDRALRVDLPDGRYRVTCTFPAPERDRYAVDVYANDRRVVRSPEVRADSDDVTADFEVEVTGARLVLVLHSPARRIFERGRRPVWAFGGLEIEALEPASGGDAADTPSPLQGRALPNIADGG